MLPNPALLIYPTARYRHGRVSDRTGEPAEGKTMRIVDVVEINKPIASPIRNAYIDFSKMTASLVAVVTDVMRDGRRVVGYGFNSNGRDGPGGPLPERLPGPHPGAGPPGPLHASGGKPQPPKGLGAPMKERK